MPSRIFRALIVDDEISPRLHLRSLLRAHPEIHIVGEAVNVGEAEELAMQQSPDLIFLDVQMPGPDGFSLLDRLKDQAHVVFVTSYDKYAYKGFEFDALDYILKPVTPSRLAESIRRLRKAPPKVKSPDGKLTLETIVVFNDADQTYTTPLRNVTAIEAEGNYTRVHTSDGQPPRLMLRSLAGWELVLPSPPFTRIDRSIIVNLTKVREVDRESRNQAWMHLEGASEAIAIGRTAGVRLRSALRGENRLAV